MGHLRLDGGWLCGTAGLLLSRTNPLTIKFSGCLCIPSRCVWAASYMQAGLAKLRLATVTIRNYQMYRHIEAPGWRLNWSWARGEVIWAMMGAETTERGDCSRFGGGVDGPPHCCDRSPKVVDLLPGMPYNQQISQCCRGGILGSMVQDQAASVSMFQMTVSAAGTTKKTVRQPKSFILEAPGPGYTCGPARVVDPTRYPSADRRRHTQALVSWNVICTYSQFLASATPTCCVSLSSFYSKMLVSCRTCACGCKGSPGRCAGPNSPDLSPAPRVQCTSHMCPVRGHWHIKLNYKEYWRVKISVTNFNYKMNYTQWNLVVQHPNFNNMTTSYSFNSHSLGPYGDINDTTMFWGLEYFNDMLLEAGLEGNVQSDILFGKSKSSFTFANGWASLEGFILMATNALCPLLMSTQGCQAVVGNQPVVYFMQPSPAF